MKQKKLGTVRSRHFKSFGKNCALIFSTKIAC